MMMKASVLLGALLLGVARADEPCLDKFDCTADPKKSFVAPIYLEYEHPESCEFRGELEKVLVEAYNELARLHCDFKCFRQAKDAMVITKSCGKGDTYHRDLKFLQDERVIIVDLYLEQTGECVTALDAAKNDQELYSKDEYEKICEAPPSDFPFDYYKDQYKHTFWYSECCCPCGSDQTLAEDDLLKILNDKLKAKQYPCPTHLYELGTDEKCGHYRYEYEQAILTEYTGKVPALNEYQIKLVEALFEDLYNGISFDQCDMLGRQIYDMKTTEFIAGRYKHAYANEYPQDKCDKWRCTESQTYAKADCKMSCPSDDKFCLICETGSTVAESSERRLDQDYEIAAQDERSLYDYPLYDTPTDLIFDQCLCYAHVNGTGIHADKETFIDKLNGAIMGKKEFLMLGAVHDITEYDTSPVAGEAHDSDFSVSVYFEGPLCTDEGKVDDALVSDLTELVRRSYNDMAIEECDWPLYRNLVDVYMNKHYKDDKVYCDQHEFVLHLTVTLRCNGYCKGPFDDYDSHYSPYGGGYLRRHLAAEPQDETTSTSIESAESHDTDRALKSGKYKEPLLGLCALDTAHDPKSPTLEGWEANANKYKPDSISLVDILYNEPPLCRCEFSDEHLYGDSYSHYYHSYHDYYKVNGIYVIPYKTSECYNSGGRRNLQYTATLFYCE